MNRDELRFLQKYIHEVIEGDFVHVTSQPNIYKHEDDSETTTDVEYSSKSFACFGLGFLHWTQHHQLRRNKVTGQE